MDFGHLSENRYFGLFSLDRERREKNPFPTEAKNEYFGTSIVIKKITLTRYMCLLT